MTDIVVTFTRTGTYMIEDIDVAVPHGHIISIPAEKALPSKDLWRAISQRILFQFHPGSIHKGVTTPTTLDPLPKPPEPTVYKAPEALVTALHEHGEILREAMELRDASLYAVILAQQDVLDELRKSVEEMKVLLRERPVGVMSRAMSIEMSTGVSGEAPIFIPSTIKPKDVDDAHVNVQTDSQEGTGVAGAASALRKIRQSGGQ